MPRQRSLCSLVSVTLSLLAVSAVFSAPQPRLLRFSAGVEGARVVLWANATPMLRAKTGNIPRTTLEQMATTLNDLALRGLRPDQIEARPGEPGNPNARLVAAGSLLLTIEPKVAQAEASTPTALAQSWARNLKHAFSAPYVTLTPLDALAVPLGETRPVRWGGTATVDLAFTIADAAVAAVKLDPTGRALQVQGLGCGETRLLTTLGEQQWSLPLTVKAWAARTTAEVVAEVTSPPLPADDLRRVLRNAALAGLKPGNGATVALGEPQRQGNSYLLRVQASGRDCFAVDKSVAVSLKTLPAPRQKPRELLVSNSPERIIEPAALLRERLLGASPIRLLWHHVNSAAKPLRFAVRLSNLSDTDSRVHVTDSAMGPHDDEIHVGHTAMTRFMEVSRQGEGYYLSIPARRSFDLYDTRLSPGRIVSGLATLTPDAGSNLMLEVLAEDAWPTEAWFPPVPERLWADPPLTPYRFEAAKTVELEYNAGGAWTFYHIGKDFSTNLQGQKLYGDYGVEYTLRATFGNPTDKPARCEMSLRASGGVARATLLIDGQLIETGLLRGANEQVIHKVTLDPGARQTVTLVTIPESGSNYPITLTMRSWQ